MASIPNPLTMNCPFCGIPNNSGESRCDRCGRRLHLANPRSAPELYSRSLTAVAVQPALAPASPPPPAQKQPDLFPAVESPRVVSIAAKGGFTQPKATPKPKPAPRATGEQAAQRRAAQQELAFIATAPIPNRRPKLEAESVIYCDAPVATAQHRTMAAAMDTGIILSSLLILGTVILAFAPGALAEPWGLGAFAGMSVLLVVFYQCLWVLANGDSAGMRWAQLRLTNFDGRRPRRKERFLRMFGMWLSVLPAGLGLLWSLMDEETLTWHDQISKTFPTPADAASE